MFIIPTRSSLVLLATALTDMHRRFDVAAVAIAGHIGLRLSRSVENLYKVSQHETPERPEDEQYDCTHPEEKDVLWQWFADHFKVKLENDQQFGDDDAYENPRLAANLLALTVLEMRMIIIACDVKRS